MVRGDSLVGDEGISDNNNDVLSGFLNNIPREVVSFGLATRREAVEVEDDNTLSF